MAPPEEIEEEKLEFLKREEIRTMQKDIAALREIEAQKERERIAALKSAEARKFETPSKITRKEAAIPETTLIPKPPKRPHPLRKALIRLILFLLLVFLIGFFYWFYFRKEKGAQETPPQEETPQQEEENIPEETPPEEEVIEEQEIVISPSLIKVDSTSTQEIEENKKVLDVLEQLIQEDLPANNFIRVVFKNTQENKILGLKDFLEAVSTTTQEDIYQKLQDDFTLFIYTQTEGKRIGLITEIKEKEGFETILRSWEPAMKTDFEDLFKIMDETAIASSLSFKTATYSGVSFRYQTFSIPHFGICYSILDRYFIFTSSGKSIMKVIDQLKK